MRIEEAEKRIREAGASTAIYRNAPMAAYSSFKAGGAAALLVEPRNAESLQQILQCLEETGIPVFVMGNGSNLLVRDGGFPGVIIKIGEGMAKIRREGNCLRVQAGALLSTRANFALEQSLTGFEFAAGIPGSIGGAAFMNAGAYDGEMKQVVREVTTLSADGTERRTRSLDEMDYGYRHSSLMDTGEVITEVLLELAPGAAESIRETMRDLAARRSSKQPLQYPSAGSFFKRPPGHYAGGLIQEAGLKGLKIGGARVSPLHAGFIINEGGASATDILNLMEVVRNTVLDRSGVLLEPEVRIIGVDEYYVSDDI